MTSLLDADALIPKDGNDIVGATDGPLDAARTLIEAAVQRGIVTAAEGSALKDVLERVRAASTRSST
ncbi:MAG TPA: hypothetical protein VEC09_01715 [Actinomycetota bacterium]|nr:hypothetical protein [Actinomycetota bacterium]